MPRGMTPEDRIDREAQLFQEAWLNHFGLTRFLRFILTILIAFIAASAFVQTSERIGCNRRQPEFEATARFIHSAYLNKVAEARTVSEPRLKVVALRTAASFKRESDTIEKNIVHDCNKVYPILPFDLFGL